MRISCQEIRENLSPCIDGELPPEMVVVIEAHLKDCPECRELANELKAVSGLLRSLPHRKAPDGLADEIIGGLERQVLLADIDDPQPLSPHLTDRTVSNSRPSAWPRIAAIAACVALAAGIALLQMVQTEAPYAATGDGGIAAAGDDNADDAAADHKTAAHVPGESNAPLGGAELANRGERLSELRGLPLAATDGRSSPGLTNSAERATATESPDSGYHWLRSKSESRVAQTPAGYNRLVVVTNQSPQVGQAEIDAVASQLAIPLKITGQRIVTEGDKRYLATTYNGSAGNEQIAALNFYIANNVNLDVAEGTGLFATAPQTQQLARIANRAEPELSKQLQREADFRNFAAMQSRDQFAQRLRRTDDVPGTTGDPAATGAKPGELAATGAASDADDPTNVSSTGAGGSTYDRDGAAATTDRTSRPGDAEDVADPAEEAATEPRPLTPESRYAARRAPVSRDVAPGATNEIAAPAGAAAAPAAPAEGAGDVAPSEGAAPARPVEPATATPPPTTPPASTAGDRVTPANEKADESARQGGESEPDQQMFERIMQERQAKLLGDDVEEATAALELAKTTTPDLPQSEAEVYDEYRANWDGRTVIFRFQRSLDDTLALQQSLLGLTTGICILPPFFNFEVADAQDTSSFGEFATFSGTRSPNAALPVEIEVRNLIENDKAASPASRSDEPRP